MPKTTYGPEIQKRVKRLLEALLCFADGEVEDGKFNIEHKWKEEDSANPKLTIETTLVTLELLTQKDKYPSKLTKTQIREALNLLKDFLNILEDNRLQTKGVEDWRFTLTLWSRDREKNLKRFDEVWQSNRPKKSKQLEANFTQDEGVADAPQTKLTLFQAPPLPEHFVERPEYSDDLKTPLLTEPTSGSRALVITAIHGLGSVGKSTLAAALAHDQEVQTRFCDGILWATLGQQPDVLSLLSGWVQALGDYSFKPTSVEATSTHLRTLLYDKAVLLVVDDAWNTKDAQAFNFGGVRCQVLVTTREASIADALAVRPYNLDIMKPNQAMELLTKKLGRKITGAERESAENLAKGVGYLPLALELAAAEVVDGTTWDELLADIRQEVARLRSFDRPEAEEITDEASLKRLSLTASLNLSVKRMPTEKQQHFSWLGVLPEDVININKKMAATLWEMDERDAAKTLQYLRNKALLLTGVPLADSTPTYRLHDLFHDLACNLLTAAPQPKRIGDLPGLGFNLVDAHAVLLQKYRQKTQNNLWHTLPDDGYIHQRLIWHLEKAGQIAEIHSLLREELATGNNGWYEAREKLGQTGGYITDISRAWELAEANWNESTLSQVVSLQCRYGLITASVNSLAANVPVQLLVALVKKKVWTAEQGLAYALQNPEPEQKVEALAELVKYLPPNLEKLALSEALTTARAIQDKSSRGSALIALADKLPPELLPEALTTAKAIQFEKEHADALIALADKLPPELLPEALSIARGIKYDWYRADVLSALSDKLPEVLPEALTTARAIESDLLRVDALRHLADKLPEVLLEALSIARAIESDGDRVYALRHLADKLPEVLPEALTTAREIQFEKERADALITLADKLPSELLPEALNIAKNIQNEFYRAIALSALNDKLSPELLAKALIAAKEIKIYTYNERDLVFYLQTLADKLPPELLPEALNIARDIQDELYRVYVLSALVEKLPEVLPEALITANKIYDKRKRVYALNALSEKLPPKLLPELLTFARAIQDEGKCFNALNALADKLPEVLADALSFARAIQDEIVRAYALRALADRLPEVLPEALTAARAIQNESSRLYALNALADRLPEVLPEALAAARAIQNEFLRAFDLGSLADKLPSELLAEALTIAKAIQSESDRAHALSKLADKLPSELLPEALTAAKAIQSDSARADALKALADKLPPELLPEALTAAREIQEHRYRADALKALADKLPEVLLELLTDASEIQSESNRAFALSELAKKLPPELLSEALTVARTIQNESDRAYVLRHLADKLPEVLPEALTAARAIQNESDRARALSALADKLPEVLPEALAAARAIQKEWSAYLVRELSEKLPEVLPEAFTAAKAIQDESDRAYALSGLADKLLPELLPEAFTAAKEIQSVSDRAIVMSALSDKLPLELLPEGLIAARQIQNKDPFSLRSNRDDIYRADVLKVLASGLSQIPSAKLFPLWQDTLHELSVDSRSNLLEDIKALFPVIFALGGEAATVEIVHAILDVARWWR